MTFCNPNSGQSRISLHSNCSFWLYAVAQFHIVEIIYASDVRKRQMRQISSVVSGIVDCSSLVQSICVSETLSGHTHCFYFRFACGHLCQVCLCFYRSSQCV